MSLDEISMMPNPVAPGLKIFLYQVDLPGTVLYKVLNFGSLLLRIYSVAETVE